VDTASSARQLPKLSMIECGGGAHEKRFTRSRALASRLPCARPKRPLPMVCGVWGVLWRRSHQLLLHPPLAVSAGDIGRWRVLPSQPVLHGSRSTETKITTRAVPSEICARLCGHAGTRCLVGAASQDDGKLIDRHRGWRRQPTTTNGMRCAFHG
jgi:hypothetical protein